MTSIRREQQPEAEQPQGLRAIHPPNPGKSSTDTPWSFLQSQHHCFFSHWLAVLDTSNRQGFVEVRVEGLPLGTGKEEEFEASPWVFWIWTWRGTWSWKLNFAGYLKFSTRLLRFVKPTFKRGVIKKFELIYNLLFVFVTRVFLDLSLLSFLGFFCEFFFSSSFLVSGA